MGGSIETFFPAGHPEVLSMPAGTSIRGLRTVLPPCGTEEEESLNLECQKAT